jgi:hypothetical protein
VLEAELRACVGGGADADAQQALGTYRSKHILVGFIVANIQGRVAYEQTTGALERSALGGCAFRQHVDDQPSVKPAR